MTCDPMKQKENGYYAAILNAPGLVCAFRKLCFASRNSMNNVSDGDISPGDGEVTTCSPCSLDSSTDSFIFGDEILP